VRGCVWNLNNTFDGKIAAIYDLTIVAIVSFLGTRSHQAYAAAV
jgi:hypothetical protein